MARQFVTFSAASSGQRCTCAPSSTAKRDSMAAPSVPTPAPAPRAATHSETVPSPTIKDFAEGLKNAPVQRTKGGK